ncbi:DUF6476 family protein [Nioella nitratireducens]|uniref:DUF6476 family protein n=1 Tax=Nioella nitratireducens TaxID=1287720 RepID=UPI002D21B69F|nr:DUF6476 family protein [Nioella nitratireducens]
MTEDDPDPLNLRVLRLLVTALTVVMIVGLITVVIVFVTRFPNGDGGTTLSLPSQIELPAGVTADAITMGADWYAVVTDDQIILIYDRNTGALRQSVEITGN